MSSNLAAPTTFKENPLVSLISRERPGFLASRQREEIPSISQFEFDHVMRDLVLCVTKPAVFVAGARVGPAVWVLAIQFHSLLAVVRSEKTLSTFGRSN